LTSLSFTSMSRTSRPSTLQRMPSKRVKESWTFSSTTQVTANFYHTWEMDDRATGFRAGIAEFGKNQNASTADVSAIRDCVEVNLIGLVQTTTTFLPLLRASKQAVILNVTTEMASNSLQAGPNALIHVVAYNTSKAAVNSYTIALAQELKKEGIKVNTVTPGFTSSKLNNFLEGGKTTRRGAEALLPWALIDKDGPTCEYCYATDISVDAGLCRSVFG
jgi:NAD(P)-dependent dehydrogenase (short-subunit alcohol dehydrogenase family)